MVSLFRTTMHSTVFCPSTKERQGGLEQAVDVFLRDGFVGECADAAAVFQQFKHDCLLANGEKLFVIVAQRKPKGIAFEPGGRPGWGWIRRIGMPSASRTGDVKKRSKILNRFARERENEP